VDSASPCYIFKGMWDNGWASFGSGNDMYFTDSGDTSGTLNITTYTPEPKQHCPVRDGLCMLRGISSAAAGKTAPRTEKGPCGAM